MRMRTGAAAEKIQFLTNLLILYVVFPWATVKLCRDIQSQTYREVGTESRGS